MERESKLEQLFKVIDEWTKLIHLISEDESFHQFKISYTIFLGKSWYPTEGLLNYTGVPEIGDES